MCHSQNPFPCLQCHPHTYIRMVQHMIERCLMLHMNQDQCVKALDQHAHIQPLVTITVWKELLKENKDFFKAYYHTINAQIPIISTPSGFSAPQDPEEEEDDNHEDD